MEPSINDLPPIQSHCFYKLAINFLLKICLYHTAPNFGQSARSYEDSPGLSQSATPFMSVWSSAGLPFSVRCALPVAYISNIRLTIISVDDDFRGTNYYRFPRGHCIGTVVMRFYLKGLINVKRLWLIMFGNFFTLSGRPMYCFTLFVLSLRIHYSRGSLP
jgi:hypothetical protein